jgi:hypothetical protein
MRALLLKALSAITLLTLGVCAYAQAPGVTVTATLTDGQGNIQKTGYLHFELWNCGNNVPQVQGNAFAIVAQQFDMRPNPTTGLIAGSVYGQDQILCGNVNSTQWLVTEYKASNQAGGQPEYYCLTSGDTFNPALTQPCTVIPPPPGFYQLFGNPINSQTWTQPTGTSAFFKGLFDFSQATVIGLGVGVVGAANISVNSVPLGSTVPVANFNNVLPLFGAGFLNCNFATDTTGDISLGCPVGNLASQFAPGSGGSYLSLVGGTVTGPITLPGNPTAINHASNKGYVDTGLAAKASLVGGYVPTAQLGSGAANSATILAGNQTWIPVPSPGSFPFSVNSVSQSAANLNAATPAPQTGYFNCLFQQSAPNVSVECPNPPTAYVTSAMNWSKSSTTALTANTAATVTLASGIVGIDVSSGAGYQVYITDGSNSEAVNVTGGTYTAGSGGTILFTPFFSHSAYTIGSASSGIQETVNVACGTDPTYYKNAQCNVTIPANGPGYPHSINNYNVYGTIFVHANQSTLSGYGTSLNCVGRGACIQVGDRVNANDFVSNTIQGISFRTPTDHSSIAAYAGVNITNTSFSGGIATITTASAHGFRPGDIVTQMFTDSSTYWGDAVITSVPSSVTYTYAHPGAPVSMNTPGVVALAYEAILDNANGTHFNDISGDLVGENGAFNNFFDFWDDENATVDHFNNNSAGLNGGATWIGSYVFSGGQMNIAHNHASVITLRDSNITSQQLGITVYNSNGLYIENTVIQATSLWQVYSSNSTGNYQGAYLKNIYSESSAAANPPCSSYPSSCSAAESPFPGLGIAGLIAGESTLNANFQIAGPAPEGAFQAGVSSAAITAASESGGGPTYTITITSTLNPGTGTNNVAITGMTPSGYNGTWSVTASNSSTFQLTTSSVLTAGTVFGTAAGATPYTYYIVANDTTANTQTSPMQILNWSSTGSDSIPVSWPRVANGTDTITYDVIRMTTPVGVGAVYPYNGGCPGGSGGTCGYVAHNLSQATACSGTLVCTYTDTGSSSTSAYTIKAGNYAGQLNFWPGSIVAVNKTVKVDVEVGNVVGIGLYGDPIQVANRCSVYGAASPGGATVCLSSINTTNNSIPNATATFLQDNNPHNSFSVLAKGRLNFSLFTPGLNPHHIITLIDSQPALTQATWGYRPPASANDTWIGTDVPSAGVGLSSGQLAFGAPVSITNYIAQVGDGVTANWLERLTASLKEFNVPAKFDQSVTLASLSNGCLNVSSGVILSTGTGCGSSGSAMTWPTTPGVPVCIGTPCTAWATTLTVFGSAAGTATSSDPGTTAEVPMVADGTHGQKPSASGALNTGAFAALYSLPTATASVLGGVKPDGTSVLNTAGAISVTKTSVGLSSVTNDAQTKAAVMPNTAPGAGYLAVGNSGGTAYAPTALSQDCTLASTGVATCTKTNNVAFGTFATQSYAAPPTIGGTTPAPGFFSTLASTTSFSEGTPITGNSGGTPPYDLATEGALDTTLPIFTHETTFDSTNHCFSAEYSDGSAVVHNFGCAGFLGRAATWTAVQTHTAEVVTAASTTTTTGLNVPHGSAPTSPVNGDLWTTTAGMYARINGGTVGPFGAAGSSGLSGMTATQIPVAATANTITSSVAAPTGTIVGTTDTQVLTNKTVDGVTSTVMGYVDPTSSIQTQLNAKAPSTSPTLTTASVTPQSIDCHTACSPTAAQLSNAMAWNYGQTTAAVAITGPTPAAGMNFIMIVGTAPGAYAWQYNSVTNGTTAANIYLDGSASGVTHIIFATPGIGNSFSCFSFQTGASAYSLKCTTLAGTSTSS